MAVINENNFKQINVGKVKKYFRFTNGNLIIEYVSSEKKYILKRIDGKPFDGITEDLGAKFYGDFKVPVTLDEKIEYELNLFVGVQTDPEIMMFDEFDWHFNEDKTQIIITPIFLEDTNVTTMSLPGFDNKLGLFIGKEKKLRNGNMLKLIIK